MITESQDLGLTSHPKDVILHFIRTGTITDDLKQSTTVYMRTDLINLACIVF